MKFQTILVAGILFSGSLLCAESALLTDNHRPNWVSNAFPANTPKIQTGAKIEWISEGEFACDPGIVKTGSRPNGTNRILLDGRIGPEGDCQAYGSWGGGTKSAYVSFLIDLNAPYLIDSVTVWAQQKDQIGSGEYEILLGNDKKKFVSVGSRKIDSELRTGKKNLALRFDYKLEKPAAARYVQFRIKKRGGAWQQQIAEVAVWGRQGAPETVKQLSPENQRPQVRFTLKGIQDGAVTLDWSEFARGVSGVKNWKFYTTPGAEAKEVFPAKITKKVVFPLEPGKTYSFGIGAVYEDGEDPNVKFVNYTVPQPFACEKLGDMLAVNYYWGGDGEAVRQPHHEQRSWDIVAIELLRETPFKQVRWWRAHPHVAKRLYEAGIGMFSWASNHKDGKQIGMHTFCIGNEPELSGKPASAYVEPTMKKWYLENKAACPANMVAAPAVNVGKAALKYLEDIYKLGGLNYFDVLDLHTYCYNPANNPRLPGYPTAAPEYLFERMDAVRELRKKYGDDKPMISTEFGYTDGQIANPAGRPLSKEEIARFITRGLIIHYVLGFKRVFLYSFWDAGTNPNDTEHHFGMIDYHLQKKPSYYAVCTLGTVLGNKNLHSEMKGVDNKLVYGYVFQDVDSKDKFTSVIWDGRGSYSGTFKTRPGKVELIRIYGETSSVQTAPDGTFRLIYGEAPVYISAQSPVELLKAVKVEKQNSEESAIVFTPQKKVFELLPGKTSVNADFSMKNPSGENFEATAVLENSDGVTLAEKKIQAPAGKTVSFTFQLSPGKRILELYRVRVSYEGKYASFSTDAHFYVRRLQANNGKVNVSEQRMHGYREKVIVISDDRLEVTVDPMRGGRILEMYDKIRGGNQVNLNYDYLDGLDRINFYYTIWDRVKAPGKLGISPDAEYQAEILPSGVRLTASSAGGMSLRKVLTTDGKGGMTLALKMTNNSGEEVECAYYMHPEYTVGGVGEHGVDVLKFPVGKETVVMPFWNGLGDKSSVAFSGGWWLVEDTIAGIQLKQEFSPEQFRVPRIWFGLGCYNLEMESRKGLKLKNGESWSGELKWILSELK